MYDERFVTPMREELTQIGVEEMRTPKEVEARLTADCSHEGPRGRLHAGASSDRRTHRRGHRQGSHSRLRQVLRENRRGLKLVALSSLDKGLAVGKRLRLDVSPCVF